jgi:hypothetical protein
MSARDDAAPRLATSSAARPDSEDSAAASLPGRGRDAAFTPLLLHQRDAAALCGISAREFRRWCRRGFAPAPIAGHGGRPLWARAALVDWVHQLAQQAQRRGCAR